MLNIDHGEKPLRSPDPIDKKILKLLKEDGRLSYRAIAHKMGMEGSTIRKRIKKLVEQGVIKRFTIKVGSEASDKNVTAVITVFPFFRYSEEIKKRLIDFEEVSESYYLAGRCGMLLKASFNSIQAQNDFVEKMRNIPGVAGIRYCTVTKRLT